MKIGILGAGNIASIVAPAMARVGELERYAVASRSLEKAEAFAEKFGFEKAFGSYEEMLSDPEVELVYVATPHTCHFECTMAALRHGKPVISEKPFTVNAEQARTVIDCARQHGVFVAEAMWPRYMPSRKIISDIAGSGIIGELRAMTADVYYAISENPRLTDPSLGGGALLDVGIYGLNFALMQFGTDIERVETSVQLTDTGVDGMESIVLHYGDGKMAVINSGIFAHSNRRATVFGDKGYMVIDNIVNPENVAVYDDSNALIKNCPIPDTIDGVRISGYEYEFIECVNAVKEGLIEPSSMPHSETLRVMEIMDGLRGMWNVKYPMEA